MERPPKHLVVEEEQAREGLILRRCSHVLPDGEMGQEFRDFPLTQLPRRPPAVKQHVAFHPVDIRLLGARRQVPQTNGMPYPV